MKISGITAESAAAAIISPMPIDALVQAERPCSKSNGGRYAFRLRRSPSSFMCHLYAHSVGSGPTDTTVATGDYQCAQEQRHCWDAQGWLTQEVVIAKMKSSNCDFDTSPDALKALKAANVPDAVILAMVQAPPVREDTVYISCDFAHEGDIHSTASFASPVVATVPWGTALTSIGNKSDWYLKVRTEQGIVGYIQGAYISYTKPEMPSAKPQASHPGVPFRTI